MIPVKIKITKQVLEATKGCSDIRLPTNCAIAYAIREILPDARVGKSKIFSDRGSIPLPKIATQFITEFDSSPPRFRSSMTPIEFIIEVPDEMIDISEIENLLNNSQTFEICNQN